MNRNKTPLSPPNTLDAQQAATRILERLNGQQENSVPTPSRRSWRKRRFRRYANAV